MSRKRNLSRRGFMAATIGGAAALASTRDVFSIVPRHVLGGPNQTPPSEKMNIAGIGVHGMGKGNVEALATENIVAICDVDQNAAAPLLKKYEKAKYYADYRRMFDERNDLDGVMVATPDNCHAIIEMAAMEQGLHVYGEKPLTHDIYEARKIGEATRKYGVKTQMGNRAHSDEDMRILCEWIWDGAIGDVREVHIWTDRPGGRWPQGIERPDENPPIPEGLNWDLWVGPAKAESYLPVYHPFKWRGFPKFGTGALGDMGCHYIDPAVWALHLCPPTSVEADTTPYNGFSFPAASTITYHFPQRGTMPPVKLVWYDGGRTPERPPELEEGRTMGSNGQGMILYGDKGTIMTGGAGSSPRIIPEEKMQAYERPPETIPRVDVDHRQDWVRACKGGPEACSNFHYAAPLTEIVLLGNIAIFAGEKIEWNSERLEVTNVPEANQWVKRDYRDGWFL